eukprot:7652373-Pyramimonas_sp.AAC.1
MRAAPLGPSVELPMRPRSAVPPVSFSKRNAFGGASYRATKGVSGVPKWACGAHVGTPTGIFGGAPYGATKRVR